MATNIGGFIVERILVDRDSSHDIMFTNVLSKMPLKWNGWVFPTNKMAYFGGDQHAIVGDIALPLTIGESPLKIPQMISFSVVDASAPFIGIME